MRYRPPRYEYRRPRDLDRAEAHHPVVVVGGGMVGLTLALDLERRGVHCVLLDEDDTVSSGSRAICFAQRTLEIYDRLGLGARMLAKGVTWNKGSVYFRDREIFAFDLLPEAGYQFPAFVNLQQYYAEEWLVEACAEAGVELRWRNRVVAVENRPDHVALAIETPDGRYRITAEWLLACDGSRSFVRDALRLPFAGAVFQDRFLIADVVMHADFPPVRRFWFDPPFHPGQSVLLHKQPDDVWRIDFQLGRDADPEAERRPERVIPRIKAMLGEATPFELEWVSVYTFCCRRLRRFVHGRVIFAGDSAHQVSPFGARGGNGGVQDADNLAWKLAAVARGHAPASLLASYDAERIPAADENIRHSTRSTDFITPKSAAARAYRDASLTLAEHYEFARPLINSGRLSRPAVLDASPLNDPNGDRWPGCLRPGSPAIDAPVEREGRAAWLLRHLQASGFTLLAFGAPELFPAASPAGTPLPLALTVVAPQPAAGALLDRDGLAARRYGALAGSVLLLRPDQHAAAWFRRYDAARIVAAVRHALGAPALVETA